MMNKSGLAINGRVMSLGRKESLFIVDQIFLKH